jgi:hypothetical protein
VVVKAQVINIVYLRVCVCACACVCACVCVSACICPLIPYVQHIQSSDCSQLLLESQILALTQKAGSTSDPFYGMQRVALTKANLAVLSSGAYSVTWRPLGCSLALAVLKSGVYFLEQSGDDLQIYVCPGLSFPQRKSPQVWKATHHTCTFTAGLWLPLPYATAHTHSPPPPNPLSFSPHPPKFHPRTSIHFMSAPVLRTLWIRRWWWESSCMTTSKGRRHHAFSSGP